MIETVANIVLAVLGIGFLIFMHELGHFLAARLFHVRVETFSLGFGPRLAGWRRGDTDYRISALPLGGYVKMAGEYGDFDDEEALAEDDLTAKPIWQRFVIFSGGVVVNFLLAFLIFPIAFGQGVPFVAPQVGRVLEGGPAWAAGLQPGDEILAVNDAAVYGFNDVALEVALSDPQDTRLHVRRDGREQVVKVVPRRTEGRYDLGIVPDSNGRLVVQEGRPAHDAGLRTDDLLLAINGLTVGTARDGRDLTALDVFSLARDGGPLAMRVERDGEVIEANVEPVTVDADDGRRLLGAQALETLVGEVRGAAAAAGFPLREGDVLSTLDGQRLIERDDILSLLRAAQEDTTVTVELERDGAPLSVTLDATQRASILAGDVAWMPHAASTAVQVLPGSALEDAGVRSGDVLLALDGRPLADYDDLLERMREDPEKVQYLVAYEQDGVERSASVRTRPVGQIDYGFSLKNAQVRHEMDLSGALVAGWDASINALRTTGLTLSKLITGEVGAKNLGGPLSISYITYKQAERDFANLLFFLALLSVNLGFINILPIPVLDGGQILFLLCEKVKGSRLSESFMANAQLAGFVAILALMAYVTWNDAVRFWA